MNDVIFILDFMSKENKNRKNNKMGKINMDANDYIIMRDGIEPIWEDPRNSDGGTFTIKLPNVNGYNTWSTFVMYILGERLTYNMDNINGITVSYIPDNNIYTSDKNYSYIKIWDGTKNSNKQDFMNILPKKIKDLIKNESIDYLPNNKKKGYGKNNVISRINNNQTNYRRRGYNYKY